MSQRDRKNITAGDHGDELLEDDALVVALSLAEGCDTYLFVAQGARYDRASAPYRRLDPVLAEEGVSFAAERQAAVAQ